MDLAKSIGAQITLALRTPLLTYQETEVRLAKGRRGERTITRGASLPAWFIVGGVLTAAFVASSIQAQANQVFGGSSDQITSGNSYIDGFLNFWGGIAGLKKK